MGFRAEDLGFRVAAPCQLSPDDLAELEDLVASPPTQKELFQTWGRRVLGFGGVGFKV